MAVTVTLAGILGGIIAAAGLWMAGAGLAGIVAGYLGGAALAVLLALCAVIIRHGRPMAAGPDRDGQELRRLRPTRPSALRGPHQPRPIAQNR